jgi:transcriptional regulator with GAF, ATPase, and Fis domain
MHPTSPEHSPLERETRLVGAFVALADTLVADYDVVDLLHQLVDYCCELLGVAAAGIMLSDQRGSLQLLASSSEQTRLLELFQLQADQGPCLDCFRTGEPVTETDLAATDRWPVFAPHAAEQGYHYVHAVPLRLREQIIGAFNLFGDYPADPPTHDLTIARALADVATIGILHERAIRRGEVLTEQLQTALTNRVIIEQAKGVLAHAGGLEMETAFEALRAYGRHHSTRLSELAHQLATTHLDPQTILAFTPTET